MKKIFHLIILVSLTSLFTACYKDARSVDPATPLVKSGAANFTKYVAVGNSLTAGFADGGLYNASMATSYPNLLAAQFRLAGGGSFVQALFASDRSDGTAYRKQVGLPSSGTCSNNVISGSNTPQSFDPLTPSASCGKFAYSSTTPLYNPTGTSPVLLFDPYIGAPLNNLGVPGIRVNQIKAASLGNNRAFNPGTGDIFFNPYFERMLNSSNRTVSYFDYVTAQVADATFFTCWLGNNDVLGYATAGAPDVTNFSNDMTDLATFTTNLTDMVNKLTENNRRGVIVTIPYVDRAPFFTTVTLAAIQGTLQCATGTPNMTLYIQGKNGTRAATASDLFLLTSQGNYALLGRTNVGTGQPFPYGLHPNNPILDIHVLDSDEVADIKTRTDQFNGVMASLVAAKPSQLALVNINTTILDALASPAGFSSYGITYRSTYLQGGAFSTDGIHLTPAGYAVTANEIIKACNTRFGSAIPLINTAGYSTVKFYTSLCQNP